MTAESLPVRQYDPHDPPRFNEWVRVSGVTVQPAEERPMAPPPTRKWGVIKWMAAAMGLLIGGGIGGVVVYRAGSPERRPPQTQRVVGVSKQTKKPDTSIRGGLMGGQLAKSPKASRSFPSHPEEPNEPKTARRAKHKVSDDQPAKRSEPRVASTQPEPAKPKSPKLATKLHKKADEPLAGSVKPSPADPPKDKPRDAPDDRNDDGKSDDTPKPADKKDDTPQGGDH